MRTYFRFLIGTILLAGCSAQSIGTPQPTLTATSEELKAFHTLAMFLNLLNDKGYADAAEFYGGEYEALQVFNPEIDPNDHAALWKWACDNRLLQCLEVRKATFQELRGDTYIFQVEFNNPDGSLFVRGPCCGATETEMPSVSKFEFRVVRNAEGKFIVLDTPPYVP